MSYIGTQPNNVKKNIGLYNPNEILQLEKDGNWGGSLEHIETQTISSGSTMAFTSIKESVYDIHCLLGKNIESSSANTSISVRLSNDGGSSYENTNYQLALQYIPTSGTAGTVGNSSATYMEFTSDTANNNRASCMYLYNLGNSSTSSYSTFQQMETGVLSYGGSVYSPAETINAIQVLTTNTNAWTGTVELYGIKQL